MSNILIAQIGRGTYQQTKYLNGEELAASADFAHSDAVKTTGYTFEAIVHEIQRSMCEKVDHIILIGTETSYFGTLLYYYYMKSININEDAVITPEGYDHFSSLAALAPLHCDMKLDSFPKKGDTPIFNIQINNISSHLEHIESILTKFLTSVTNNPNLKVKPVIIQHGTTSSELENNFNHLQKSVEQILDEENTENQKQIYNIFFDISNGFRSLPMYIYTFVNYLLRIRDEQFKLHMFYGMADGKQKGIAPIVNLENINGMMDWINAANEFHNYGSVRQLDHLLENNSGLHRLFQQFDYASNANNLGVLKNTTEHIIKLKDVDYFTDLPYYAKALLRKIGDEFHQEFDQTLCNFELKKNGYSYAYLTIHLANWYMKQGRTGNAAIALQEGITTFMMERWSAETDDLIAQAQSHTHGRFFEQDFVKWLFDFKNRDVISSLLKEKIHDLPSKMESDTDLTLNEKMTVIREYIRNPEAHILINQISDELIEKSQQILNNMIEWMLQMTSDQVQETEEQKLFCYISSAVDSSKTLDQTIKAYFREINSLSHITHTVEINEPAILAAARELESDLKFVKTCQIASISKESDNIHKFQQRIHSRKYLKMFLEKWQNYEPSDHEKNPEYSYNACRTILRKKNGKTTEQRMINWISTHIGDIIKIIKSESDNI